MYVEVEERHFNGLIFNHEELSMCPRLANLWAELYLVLLSCLGNFPTVHDWPPSPPCRDPAFLGLYSPGTEHLDSPAPINLPWDWPSTAHLLPDHEDPSLWSRWPLTVWSLCLDPILLADLGTHSYSLMWCWEVSSTEPDTQLTLSGVGSCHLPLLLSPGSRYSPPLSSVPPRQFHLLML